MGSRASGSSRRARGHTGTQLGVRFRVAAGEQRDVVAEGHQLFGEVGDDALRPP